MKQNHFVSITLLFCLSVGAFAQDRQKMEIENVVPGVVIVNNIEIQGYIKKVNSYQSPTTNKLLPCPWELQSNIKFITKDVFDNSQKLSNKDYTKYDPKNCQGFKYTSDSETYIYESVKFDATTGMGIMPRPMFLRVITSKKIALFHYFTSEVRISTGDVNLDESEKPQSVYRVGKEGKLKFVLNMSITKELNDCPIVIERYGKGNQEDSQKKGLINSLVKISDDYRVNRALRAIEDYNDNCQ
jgi:hypothetical protein